WRISASTLGHQNVAIRQNQRLAWNFKIGGDCGDGVAVWYRRQLVAPFGGLCDHHVRQQAALWFGQVGRCAYLQRFGFAAAGAQRYRKHGDGEKFRVFHWAPLTRGVRKPSHVATQASTVTIIDSTKPVGMPAQASRACISALRKPTIHVTSNITKYGTIPRWR